MTLSLRARGACALAVSCVLAVSCLLASAACEAPPPPKPLKPTVATELCEHEVPAALCTVHHPELVPVFKAQDDWCDEHGVPMSHCFAHNPRLTFEPDAIDLATKVRLASPETARDAGIRSVRAQKRAFSKTIEVTGQLELDGNAQAQVSTKDEARVLEVKVDVGDVVKAGQPLVVLASAGTGAERAQLASAKARLDNANAQLARLQQLEGVAAKQDVDAAKRDVATAQAEHDAALAALKASGADVAVSSGGRLVLSSPVAGTVVAREAVPGRTASAGDVLVHVADTKTLWAVLDVPEEESPSVRPGQAVELVFEGLRGEARSGVITRVAASIDPHTRTLRARVDVPNGDGRLKAGLFVRARIAVAAEREALLLPRSALQRAEDQHVVFVVKSPGVYQPTAVELGESAGDDVEIVKGVSPGDEVVTTGAFLLKTEILKDSIGAGCCD